jgi:hypothetical protein
MSSHRRSEISGWRLKTKNEFKKLARQNTPTLVIHHPHTAVKRMTWVHAWGGLRRELPSVRSYIGTGCYSFRDKNGANRDSLNDVLEATKSPDTVDIVVSIARL